MLIKICVKNENGKTVKEFTCLTDSPNRALQMYDDEAGEMQYLTWEDITPTDTDEKG